MENQSQLPLMARLDGPAVVPAELLRTARSYRDACRLAWALRRVRRMTLRQLAAECGLPPQHVGDYLAADDRPGRRSLPGAHVAAFEAVVGNTAVTQWHSARAHLTLLEQMQADNLARVAA